MYSCNIEEFTGKWSNHLEQEKSNLYIDSSQPNSGGSNGDMYITVEPRLDGESDLNTESCLKSGIKTFSYSSPGISTPSSTDQSSNPIGDQGEMYITVNPQPSQSEWKQSTQPNLALSEKNNQRNYIVPKLHYSSQRTVYRNILPKIERRKSIASSTNNNNLKNSPRCSQCQVRLLTYKELIAHNYSAHGKLNTCPICNKFFMSRGSFIRHGVAHMQRRSFKCSVCFAYFSRKDNLKRHFKVNHKNLDWKPDDSKCVSETEEDKLDSTDIMTPSGNISPVFPKSTSPVQTIVKSSKLNSIVDNLHSRKGKLPLLRSILTTPKASNKQNQEKLDPSQPDKSKKKAVMSYVCSLCKAAFHTIRDLKSHIVRIHGESMSADKDLEIKVENLCESSVFSDDKPTNGLECSSNESTDIDKVVDNVSLSNDVDKSLVEAAAITSDESLPHTNILQIPSLNKHDSDEIDIESWVKSQYSYDDTSKGSETCDNQPCFPSQPLFPTTPIQYPTSGSQQFPTTSSPNNFYLSEVPTTQHSNPTKITIKKDKKNFKVVDTADMKPKKRRIAAHNEMTVCRLCGVYLVTGAEIVQHGQQSHPDQLETATCVVCFTKLSGYDALYRHCQLHFGKTFSCQFCKSKFTRKDNLTRHVKNTHSKHTNLNTTV